MSQLLEGVEGEDRQDYSAAESKAIRKRSSSRDEMT